MRSLSLLLIPLGIIVFNVLFMFTMRTVLLTAKHEVGALMAAFVALAIASTILGVATFLAMQSPRPVASDAPEPH